MDIYNSHGKQVAVLSGDALYSLYGQFIAEFRPTDGVFVDLQGRYLGEIVEGDRLLENYVSGHHNRLFGLPGLRGSIGASFGSLSSSIFMPSGYRDVDSSRLGQ